MFRPKGLRGWRNTNIDLHCHSPRVQSAYRLGKIIDEGMLSSGGFSLSVHIFPCMLRLKNLKHMPMKNESDNNKHFSQKHFKMLGRLFASCFLNLTEAHYSVVCVMSK